jgi:membrane protein
MTPENPAVPTAPPAPVDGRADLRQRPAAELVRDLSTQVSTLVRQELELARAELTAKGKQGAIGAGMFGGAGLFALYGTGALVAAAILALATAVDGWLAAIIIGAALFVVAGILALMGKARAKRAVPPAPEQTLASVKEDVRFTKEHVAEARHHHEENVR